MTIPLDLPESPDEPKPWYYLVWRWGSPTEYLCLNREDAWKQCTNRMMADLDEYVEGVFDPEDNFVGRPEIEY